MAGREIIEIDEAACDGCGECEAGCPEGALRVIDGKARLVGESLCDGLGACIGACPRGALVVSKREAKDYAPDARGAAPAETVQSPVAVSAERGEALGAGRDAAHDVPRAGESRLSHWPIQLHLVNPRAPHFAGSALLIAADCTAFALGSFHDRLLDGRNLVIACPKLDRDREVYIEKLAILLESAASVEAAIMEVPCCSGLLKLALEARGRSVRKPSIRAIILGIEGGIIGERDY